MKIVVTGAAGAIGSHLCERLLDEGHKVIGIDSLHPYYSPVIKRINVVDVETKGGKVYFSDLISDDLDHLLKKVDIIYHLAAQPGISNATPFEDYLNNNLIATHNILKKAKNINSLRGFIHASTSSVYGAHANGPEDSELKPISHYGITKLAGEQLAMSYFRESKLPVTILRLFSVYGERERPEKLYHRLIKAIYEKKKFPLYKGAREHSRSYTYISDIIDGFILILENLQKAAGRIYNLGSNQSVTTGKGIDIIQKIIGKEAKFENLPRRVGDQQSTTANIDKICRAFDYEPKISLEEGLENQVKWYRDKIHGKI